MSHRIIWIHGIGDHRAGYSRTWSAALNEYTALTDDSYAEVCWEEVFDAARGTRGDSLPELTPDEQAEAERVRMELETIMLARASALREAGAPVSRGDGEVLTYEEMIDIAGGEGSRGTFDWLWNPDEFLGDFVKYLVSRGVREAVKERAKQQLRPLAGGDARVTVVGHSWGTVVAYDALLDAERELPSLGVVNLMTMGSPLWMVRPFLTDRSGRKPRTVARWTNVHARGDLIGSWLRPGFRVDNDHEVPTYSNVGAHSSYFEPHNEPVLKAIMSRWILA